MSIVSSNDHSTETGWIISAHPEPTQSVSQHPSPVPELPAQQLEDHSESPSFCDNHQETAQSVSPSDVCLQGSKRPAPVETHDTTDPQLEYPQQAKRACSSLEPVSQCFPESALEFTSINFASTSTVLSPEDKGTEHIMTIYHKQFELVNQTKQDMLVKANTFSANSSFEINVEQRFSADPCDLPVCSALDEREKVSHLQAGSPHSTATSPNTCQALQAQSNTATTNTGLCQMPISAIISVRPDPRTTAKRGGTVAASQNHGQFSQRANGLSGGVGYIRPNSFSVYTGSSYHSNWYPAGVPWASLAPQIPRECVNRDMDYRQQQQQYAPSTSNTLPARNEDVTSDVTTQFSTVANNTRF